MALEFALRPRIDLERPAPRRWRLRLPRFALLMAAYWVGTAGATVVLLRKLKEEPETAAAAERAEEPPAERAEEPPAERTEEPPAERAEEPPAERAPQPDEPVAATTQEPPVAEATVAPVAAPEPLPTSAPAPRIEPRPAAPVLSEPKISERPVRVAEPPPPPLPRESVTAPPKTATTGAVTAPLHEARPVRPESAPTSLPSCEAAAASANQTIDLEGGRSAPDLPREAFAGVLDNGAYLAGCALPARTALDVCAAVQDGKVVGVSVDTEPRSAELNACVRRAVAALRFPRSPHLDVTRTRFGAAR